MISALQTWRPNTWQTLRLPLRPSRQRYLPPSRVWSTHKCIFPRHKFPKWRFWILGGKKKAVLLRESFEKKVWKILGDLYSRYCWCTLYRLPQDENVLTTGPGVAIPSWKRTDLGETPEMATGAFQLLAHRSWSREWIQIQILAVLMCWTGVRRVLWELSSLLQVVLWIYRNVWKESAVQQLQWSSAISGEICRN